MDDMDVRVRRAGISALWPGLMLAGALACAGRAEEWQHPPKPVPQDIAIPAGPFAPTWDSLGKHEVPAWFLDAKFGMFDGEAIYGTRPWAVFGEGPTAGLGPTFQGNPPPAPYTPQDLRFTAKGDALYAIALAWPESRKLTIKSLASGSPLLTREISGVSLLGATKPVAWTRGADGLAVELPEVKPCEYAPVLKIELR